MPEDQRRHLRLPLDSTVFIEMVSPEAGSADASEVAVCRTLNVSRGGLSVGIEHELLVGSILQICLELPDERETLYLAGEVRWCRANEAPETGFNAGLALLNADGSDIDSWVALLVEMES